MASTPDAPSRAVIGAASAAGSIPEFDAGSDMLGPRWGIREHAYATSHQGLRGHLVTRERAPGVCGVRRGGCSEPTASADAMAAGSGFRHVTVRITTRSLNGV